MSNEVVGINKIKIGDKEHPINCTFEGHYTPNGNNANDLATTLSGTADNQSPNAEYIQVLTGITPQIDGKGHLTGLTYTAKKN